MANRCPFGIIREITRRKERQRLLGGTRLVMQRMRRSGVVLAVRKPFVAFPHVRVGNQRRHLQRGERREICLAVIPRIGRQHRRQARVALDDTFSVAIFALSLSVRWLWRSPREPRDPCAGLRRRSLYMSSAWYSR